MKRLGLFILILLLAVWSEPIYGQNGKLFSSDTTKGTDNIIRYYSGGSVFINASQNNLGTGINFSLTDLTNMVDVAFPNMKYELKDMEILDDLVFFCGEHTGTGSGMIGYFKIPDLFYGAGSLFIDNTLLTQGLISLENIEVFKDLGGGVHIVGYGIHQRYTDYLTCYTASVEVRKYKAFEAVGQPFTGMVYRTADLYWGGLLSDIEDVVVTDNYVVFLNCNRNQCCQPYHGAGIDLEVLPKYNMLSASYIDLGQFMTIETSLNYLPGCTLVLRQNSDPHNNQAKMVNIGEDKVAVCSHRVDIVYSSIVCDNCQNERSGTSYLAHRIYDISPLLTNNPIAMTSAVAAQLPSTNAKIGDIKGLRYENGHYYVLHWFEGSTGSGVLDCAVTKFDFSGGMPATAGSDYMNTSVWNNWTPESVCLPPTNKYVVSGAEASGLHYFRETPFASSPTYCLPQDKWNVMTIPTIEAKSNTWPLAAGAWVGLNCEEHVGVQSNDTILIICD